MIGVIANASEHAVVREFFELFKTPWEFYQTGRTYEVVLCADDQDFRETGATLIIVYGGRKLSFDRQSEIRALPRDAQGRRLNYKQIEIPIYGECIALPREESEFLTDTQTQQKVAHLDHGDERTTARIGYDLFQEVKILLVEGQPPSHAQIPALDLHIALLRNLILESGAGLVEIPPVPEGYQFIACLTHDVDHPAGSAFTSLTTRFSGFFIARFSSRFS